MSNSDSGMRGEYDLSRLKGGTRGKYAERYAKESNIVIIDEDLSRKFPNAKAVNRALRKYLEDHPDVA